MDRCQGLSFSLQQRNLCGEITDELNVSTLSSGHRRALIIDSAIWQIGSLLCLTRKNIVRMNEGLPFQWNALSNKDVYIILVTAKENRNFRHVRNDSVDLSICSYSLH